MEVGMVHGNSDVVSGHWVTTGIFREVCFNRRWYKTFVFLRNNGFEVLSWRSHGLASRIHLLIGGVLNRRPVLWLLFSSRRKHFAAILGEIWHKLFTSRFSFNRLIMKLLSLIFIKSLPDVLVDRVVYFLLIQNFSLQTIDLRLLRFLLVLHPLVSFILRDSPMRVCVAWNKLWSTTHATRSKDFRGTIYRTPFTNLWTLTVSSSAVSPSLVAPNI